jgi:hypothetical protein
MKIVKTVQGREITFVKNGDSWNYVLDGNLWSVDDLSDETLAEIDVWL